MRYPAKPKCPPKVCRSPPKLVVVLHLLLTPRLPPYRVVKGLGAYCGHKNAVRQKRAKHTPDAVKAVCLNVGLVPVGRLRRVLYVRLPGPIGKTQLPIQPDAVVGGRTVANLLVPPAPLGGQPELLGKAVVADAAVPRRRQPGLLHLAARLRPRLVVAPALLHVPKMLVYPQVLQQGAYLRQSEKVCRKYGVLPVVTGLAVQELVATLAHVGVNAVPLALLV